MQMVLPTAIGSRCSRSGCKAGAQLRGGHAQRVGRRPGLVLTPALRERAGVDRVEAELVDQPRDCSLRLLVVAESGTASRSGSPAGRPSSRRRIHRDRVEGLHHVGA